MQTVLYLDIDPTEYPGSTRARFEAILKKAAPDVQAKIVRGFQPLMPTFQGMVTEEQLLQLIAYVRSLSQAGAAPSPAGTTAPTPPQNRSQQEQTRELVAGSR